MNAFDLLALAVLLISGLIAFFRGIVHEALSIAAWIGAALATMSLLPVIQPFMREQIANEWLADGAAGLLVFVVTLIVLSILTRVASKSIQDSAMGGLDRSLGFVFGLVRGAVIVGAAMFIVDFVYKDKDSRPDWIANARSVPVFDYTADMLRAISPTDIEDVEAEAQKAAEQIEDTMKAKEMFDALTQPKPAADPDGQDPDGGYSDSERKRLDQLFESTTDEP